MADSGFLLSRYRYKKDDWQWQWQKVTSIVKWYWSSRIKEVRNVEMWEKMWIWATESNQPASSQVGQFIILYFRACLHCTIPENLVLLQSPAYLMIFHWLSTSWFWLGLWAAPLWWGGDSESCWTETRLEKWIKENLRQTLMEGAELLCCWLSDIFENHSKIYTEQDWNWLFGTTPVSLF